MGLLHVYSGSAPASSTLSLCRSRHIMLGGNTAGASARESGNEMEKVAQKDSLWSWNGGSNNVEFTGRYEANAESAGLEVGGVTLICSHTPA
ncbi:unnamed protein product [Pleuronectes platessa]|uniref:Uncharacterized protein n=1 Tax=Pleuronectes platessa TaxID=8262 RepID=A0A9N7UB89_PLEPL|nr:unnamed protein product [Pleuronectes platessa]